MIYVGGRIAAESRTTKDRFISAGPAISQVRGSVPARPRRGRRRRGRRLITSALKFNDETHDDHALSRGNSPRRTAAYMADIRAFHSRRRTGSPGELDHGDPSGRLAAGSCARSPQVSQLRDARSRASRTSVPDKRDLSRIPEESDLPPAHRSNDVHTADASRPDGTRAVWTWSLRKLQSRSSDPLDARPWP